MKKHDDNNFIKEIHNCGIETNNINLDMCLKCKSEQNDMCFTFDPYSCPELSRFGKDAIHFYLLFKAITQVSFSYVEYSEYIEDFNDMLPHLERTFAYELYRKWMNLIENEPNYNLTLNAEIDKMIGVPEVSKKVRKYPDLVLHRSQSKVGLNQMMVCEIKRKNKNLKASHILEDIFKLCLFLDDKYFKQYKFFYGVFILVRGTICDIHKFLMEEPEIVIKQKTKNSEELCMTYDTFYESHKEKFGKIICVSYNNGVVSYNSLDNILLNQDS